jgi:DNA ligase 1
MHDLRDGESVEVQGSARKPYVMKNLGGGYSCSCPAWRFQSRNPFPCAGLVHEGPAA